MKSFRPALTLCLSFLPARERRGLGTKWAPASREEYWKGMFPGWGRVEPLGFPTTLGTPAQSRWSTPPRAQKKATAGEGEDSSLAPPPLGS